MDNYTQLIERIARSSNLEKNEIERKIEAKKAKLSGLISKEGAAQIVAAELGINLDQERLKIAELVQGMKRANLIGKIIKLFPIREYNKNGREGKVATLLLADETGNIRVVLWDTNHISLIETNKIKEEDVIEIANANIRNNELHLSSFADIKTSKEKLENVITEKIFTEKKLSEAKHGESLKTRAFIVQAYEPRYFETCPQCDKRVLENECKDHGKIQPRKKALLTIVIDDGTETIRAIIVGDNIKELGLTDTEIYSLEEYAKHKEKLIGEEKIFTGRIRNNALYNTTEFTIESVENVNPEILIQQLEAKQ